MYIKRYIHEDGHFKALIIDSTLVGRKAFQELQPSPIALQLLTQAMTGALMLSASIKDEGTLLFKWAGDGPIAQVTVEANTVGDVRGFAGVNHVAFDPKPEVGLLQQAIGNGRLTVQRRIQPTDRIFESVVELGGEEISASLTHYLLESQQIRAGIQMGVSLHPELGIAGAGGVLIEALPDADHNLLFLLEERLREMPSLATTFSEENGSDKVFDHLFGDMKIKLLGETSARYFCPCTRQRTLQAVASLPLSDLQEMLDEQKTFDVSCYFCSQKYPCGPEDLQAIIDLRKEG